MIDVLIKIAVHNRRVRNTFQDDMASLCHERPHTFDPTSVSVNHGDIAVRTVNAPSIERKVLDAVARDRGTGKPRLWRL